MVKDFYVLIISNGDFVSEKYKSFEGAINSCKKLAVSCKKLFGKNHVFSIYNQNFDSIMDKLSDFLRLVTDKSQDEDLSVLIHICGHGVMDKGWKDLRIPVKDTADGFQMMNYIDLKNIFLQFKDIKRLAVSLDCCFSGNALKYLHMGEVEKIDVELPIGKLLMTSTRELEEANYGVIDGIEYALFTFHLAKVLDEISISSSFSFNEIFKKVQKSMSDEEQTQSVPQITQDALFGNYQFQNSSQDDTKYEISESGYEYDNLPINKLYLQASFAGNEKPTINLTNRNLELDVTYLKNDRTTDKCKIMTDVSEIRLMAHAGKSYLVSHADTISMFNAVKDALASGAYVKIILTNPYSYSGLLISLADDSESHTKDAIEKIIELLKEAKGDVIDIIENATWISEKQSPAINRYKKLKKVYADRIQLKMLGFDMYATTLITEKGAFFEPYLISPQQEHMMKTFEIQVDKDSYLYKNIDENFEALWVLAEDYEIYKDKIDDYKNNLKADLKLIIG